MYKEKSRERRRRDLLRMKKKAIKYFYFKDPRLAIKNANHMSVCSCFMCGNPRRYLGHKTLQELKSDLSMKD